MAIEAGKEVELDIVDVSYGGRGVGRFEGMAVFVPEVLEGERVRVRLDAVHKRYAEGTLLEVLKPSAHRQQPVCPLAGTCPGCVYQHVSYAEEVRIKQKQLDSLLCRLGGQVSVTQDEPIPSPSDLGYRNKVVLHAGPDGELGYYGHDNRTVIDVPRCPLAVDAINADIGVVRADATFKQSLAPRAPVTFRWSEMDGVRRWTDGNSPGGTMTASSPVGELRVPTGGFAQVNSAMASLLVERVTAWVKAEAPEFLIDLYCGAGVFALAAAQSGVTNVLGVEVNGPAIRAAKGNARQLALPGITFIEADAAVLFDQAIQQVDADRTAVIVDPPRQGLAPALCESLCKHKPAALLYISCAPDTLARDLKRLTAETYTVECCQVLDMFPRTAHFESMVILRLNS
jgi:23S rRNA (uracil1939-C5)-methyltransferase/tRNA (uracil-5-)-methyltransferase